MKIIIVGGGKIGEHLTRVLSKKKHSITLIENEKELSQELASNLDALVINQDGTTMSILKEAGINKCNVVISVTGDDKTNLMVSEIAKSIGVPKIIARVNNPGDEELFVKLGISLVVPVTQNTINTIENALLDGNVRILAKIGDGKATIVEVVVEDGSAIANHKGNILEGGIISAIYKTGTVTIPDIKTKIEVGDVLIIVAQDAHLNKIIKIAKAKN
ncbi:MAG: NAD-binding protein [DPANN group archaeon]|nr:NAD-binding protein [DPANN group archaeon]